MFLLSLTNLIDKMGIKTVQQYSIINTETFYYKFFLLYIYIYMDYKHKYLKYKLKYLNIEKKNSYNFIGGAVLTFNWNILQTPGYEAQLKEVINNIKKSPVIFIVGHGQIEPKLTRRDKDLDLKHNTVIGLDTFRKIRYNESFIIKLNKFIFKKVFQNKPLYTDNIKSYFRQINQDIVIHKDKMPIKNFYLNLTKNKKEKIGLYYYTDTKINLLEYSIHENDTSRYKQGEGLEDIINRFSSEDGEPKIFIIYSCHHIKDDQYLEDSPILLTEQPKDGQIGLAEMEDLQLPESHTEYNSELENRNISFNDSVEDESLVEHEISSVEDEILQKKYNSKISTEECESCNKSFCNIQ